jgi:hypothetical protein
VPEAALGMLPVGVFGHWCRYTFLKCTSPTLRF